MIGLFDSGNGGLTVFRALRARFPQVRFIYLGDHANTPYGNRPSEEIVAFTQAGVELLFERGCRLVLLACNTATAVACRALQQDWLPSSAWQGHNILGIIAPTVEAATQTPWAITSPQYPQKNNSDLIAIFATRRTVATNVYPEEIAKRCPRAKIIQQACPKLAGAIEEGVPPDRIDAMIQDYVGELMDAGSGAIPHRAILGCTHYPLIEAQFRAYLPPQTRLLSQADAVADSLEDYLERHSHYVTESPAGTDSCLLTTGDAAQASKLALPLWRQDLAFEKVA